jgi:carbonic anhydrase/acetyltransferase-like protein (isoleucine patch superfamily)
MTNKYEITANSVVVPLPDGSNITLYQIKALQDFSDVLTDDLGGYIEKESNLSQKGNCWVYDNAKVFGSKAKVIQNAQIKDNAVVSGRVIVSANAKVYGDAKVLGYYDPLPFSSWRSGYWNTYNPSSLYIYISYGAEVYDNARILNFGPVYPEFTEHLKRSSGPPGYYDVFNYLPINLNHNACYVTADSNINTQLGTARAIGYAQIGATTITGFAKVYGNAIVTNCTISSQAQVYDNAILFKSVVSSLAKVYGNASINLTNAGFKAEVYGNAQVWGYNTGWIKLDKESKVYGYARVIGLKGKVVLITQWAQVIGDKLNSPQAVWSGQYLNLKYKFDCSTGKKSDANGKFL